MLRTRLARIAAAVSMTAAGVVLLPTGAAEAAACPSSDGVTVVVDFNELGGGLKQVCDQDGGGKAAADLFTGNGFPLAYVQRQPGFVCRVSGKPNEDQDPCINTPPADAYWGLFWSDGESGNWVYSSERAGTLNIPGGGYVAFAWQGSSSSAEPGVSPTPHEDEPSDQPSPTGPKQNGGAP